MWGENADTRRTVIWYLNNNVLISGAFAAESTPFPAGWDCDGGYSRF